MVGITAASTLAAGAAIAGLSMSGSYRGVRDEDAKQNFELSLKFSMDTSYQGFSEDDDIKFAFAYLVPGTGTTPDLYETCRLKLTREDYEDMADADEFADLKCAYLTNLDDFEKKTDPDLGSSDVPSQYNS